MKKNNTVPINVKYNLDFMLILFLIQIGSMMFLELLIAN